MSALARRATETSHEDDNSNGSAPPDDVDDGLGVVEATGGDGCMGGKKAIHVKWAGKTIALGTFPIAEADEKCARAKALTRAWRSTMRPKPTREWVMLELERLQVRVVSGRLGRKGGSGEADDDEDGDGEKKQTTKKKKRRKHLFLVTRNPKWIKYSRLEMMMMISTKHKTFCSVEVRLRDHLKAW